ncbi:DUF1906 domain-containing protein [Paenibacillus anseongense]|uniref:DUF1906 domain-containing protein n=1 Tax=Paenibacillus anseongense TaxID=2682845 RepID=UPI002DB8F3D0|nr:DUF1906 domain-containing protein [Paenibacillus anseongense]MEC0265121.1 DUF1906 domain-containing protein [Paenibacillus anseongense]
MSKGFDCATPLTANTASLFASEGYTFVCRYLAPVGSWKRLTANEAAICTDAGLWIVSVFERGAMNSLGGASQGKEDGILALRYAQEVLQPENTVIYAAVDTDINSSQYDTIEAYLRAFDEQIAGYELGIYGEYEICNEMKKRGVVNKVWQTYAWSKGQKMTDPNIYQFENDVMVNGIGIDRDESDGNSGGWKLGMSVKQEYTLDQDVANTIINTWISPSWEETQDIGQKKYYNWLANQLRKAAGIPEE